MKMIRTLFAAVRRDVSDILSAVVEVCIGKEKDPARWAETPPPGWHRATPEADVPERNGKTIEIDLNAYTPEEILEMTESEYRQKVGLTGVQTWQEARKQAEKMITKRRKSNAREVEFPNT